MTAIHSKTTTTVPGPRPYPLVGEMGNMLAFLRNPSQNLQNVYQKYGALAQIGPLVAGFGPHYNREFLSQPDLYHASTFLKMAENDPEVLIGQGILLMNGEEHRQRRKLMMPAFHRRAIQGYTADMISLTEQWLNTLQPGQTIDISTAMKQLSMNIAVKTLLGFPPEQGEEVRQAIDHFLDLLTNPVYAVSIPLARYVKRHPLRQGGITVSRLLLELVHQKRQNQAEQLDALGLLMAAVDEETGERLNDRELVAEAMVLFAAGHETTATTLTWALFFLSQHPAVAQKLLAELQPLNGQAPTLEQLHGGLPTLTQVIDETLRLMPPVMWRTRRLQADHELDGYSFPAGTQFLLSPYITHRLPELYPDPHQFKPERWEKFKPSIYEFLPFGAGPKMCIGYTFAMMELKAILAVLLPRWRFSLRPGTAVNIGGTAIFRVRGEMPMTAVPQDGQYQAVSLQGNVQQFVQLPQG